MDGCKLLIRQLIKFRPDHPLIRSLSTQTSSSRAESVAKRDWRISLSKTEDDKDFIVKLNNTTIKTPLKNVLRVKDETLAQAIANEFKSQGGGGKKFNHKTMHLTTLAYEAIDNPFNESKNEVAQSIVEYLEFDTVRFRDVENEGLLKRQSRHWDPLVGWFEHQYNCHVPIEYGDIISTNSLPKHTRETLLRHLESHDRWPLIGFRFMVKNLKSFILTTCLTERFLKVEQAVELARLETKYQTEKWSEVEWEHGLDEQCTNARVAAGTLFYHLSL